MACERYATDDSLRSVPLADAERALRTVVAIFDKEGIFPLNFPIIPNAGA